MRTVKHILDNKTKPFNSITPHTLVIDALNLMNSLNLSYVVVMDGDTYKGIFSERDYSRNVILKGRASTSTTVHEAMTTDLPTVTMNDSVEYCMNMINLHKTRYLLAFDEEQFMGVITIHDLLRLVIKDKEAVFDSTLAEQMLDQDESGLIY
ncbi:MAG TPA: CBS domain-containing protein [Flavisolibacter sp.]|nr:CBS domain-containing protein [Flavisolibacter sp.]